MMVGIIGISILVILLFARMWIGFAMAFIGFLGFAYIGGFDAALGVLATVPYRYIADYTVSMVPLFIFMGIVASNTGIAEDLYRSAYKCVGQFPGGLALATVGACASFAAICAESMAEAATMGSVAVPEMKKYKYDPSLATGCVAAGGTLGILIPPSLAFVLYSILTQESVGMLFMAGILPGIILSSLFIIIILVLCLRNKTMGPPGPKTSFREKIVSLKYTWGMLALFLLVMGGIYAGIFTPTEAGAIGAFGALVIGGIGRRLRVQNVVASMLQTGQITAMIVVMIIGAFIFMRFLAISKLPFALAGFVSGLAMQKYLIFVIIIFVYIILGMFLDVISAVILTVPIIFPTIVSMGFDPIWFGVIIVLVIEMGLITPPVGMNVFVLAGVTNVPMSVIFRGVVPFFFAMILCIIIISIFPQIALFLPGLMK
jgi:tripartite ATP-independent transporter DctM subunit